MKARPTKAVSLLSSSSAKRAHQTHAKQGPPLPGKVRLLKRVDKSRPPATPEGSPSRRRQQSASSQSPSPVRRAKPPASASPVRRSSAGGAGSGRQPHSPPSGQHRPSSSHCTTPKASSRPPIGQSGGAERIFPRAATGSRQWSALPAIGAAPQPKRSLPSHTAPAGKTLPTAISWIRQPQTVQQSSGAGAPSSFLKQLSLTDWAHPPSRQRSAAAIAAACQPYARHPGHQGQGPRAPIPAPGQPSSAKPAAPPSSPPWRCSPGRGGRSHAQRSSEGAKKTSLGRPPEQVQPAKGSLRPLGQRSSRLSSGQAQVAFLQFGLDQEGAGGQCPPTTFTVVEEAGAACPREPESQALDVAITDARQVDSIGEEAPGKPAEVGISAASAAEETSVAVTIGSARRVGGGESQQVGSQQRLPLAQEAAKEPVQEPPVGHAGSARDGTRRGQAGIKQSTFVGAGPQRLKVHNLVATGDSHPKAHGSVHSQGCAETATSSEVWRGNLWPGASDSAQEPPNDSARVLPPAERGHLQPTLPGADRNDPGAAIAAPRAGTGPVPEPARGIRGDKQGAEFATSGRAHAEGCEPAQGQVEE